MKVAGLLLLMAGWGIVVAAVVLLKSVAQQTAFAIAGFAIEVLGLTLLFRAHQFLRGEDA